MKEETKLFNSKIWGIVFIIIILIVPIRFYLFDVFDVINIEKNLLTSVTLFLFFIVIGLTLYRISIGFLSKKQFVILSAILVLIVVYSYFFIGVKLSNDAVVSWQGKSNNFYLVTEKTNYFYLNPFTTRALVIERYPRDFVLKEQGIVLFPNEQSYSSNDNIPAYVNNKFGFLQISGVIQFRTENMRNFPYLKREDFSIDINSQINSVANELNLAYIKRQKINLEKLAQKLRGVENPVYKITNLKIVFVSYGEAEIISLE